VAGGVIYQSSANGEQFPLDVTTSSRLLSRFVSESDHQLHQVGRSIYNRWLVDFCSIEPARHAGLAYLPLWDIDASIQELEWCAEHGLCGVNFPAPGNAAFVQPYEPDFERFFAASADLQMTLSTHTGALPASAPQLVTETDYHFTLLDFGEWGTRTIYMLVIYGIFERHPDLKLVLTEVPGLYWGHIANNMDSVYHSPVPGRNRRLSRLPSEYMSTNVWLGSSFMSRQEAAYAVEISREDRFCWGSDYPHPEGTFRYSTEPSEGSMTRLALANTFQGLPIAKIRKMTGSNLLDAYPRVDRAALEKVGERIGMKAEEITVGPKLSEHAYVFASGSAGFRTRGAWS
jgi:predicted TIM-barrel fold metal-dependent hydrolase